MADPLKSHPGYEPKVIQSDVLELGTIELDRNLGADPYQILERILGDYYQNPSTDTEEIGKVGVEMPYVNRRCTPIMIQLEALQRRTLKMENYEKCWPHRRMYLDERKIWFFSQTHSFRETKSRSNTEERCKCTTSSS